MLLVLVLKFSSLWSICIRDGANFILFVCVCISPLFILLTEIAKRSFLGRKRFILSLEFPSSGSGGTVHLQDGHGKAGACVQGWTDGEPGGRERSQVQLQQINPLHQTTSHQAHLSDTKIRWSLEPNPWSIRGTVSYPLGLNENLSIHSLRKWVLEGWCPGIAG